MRFPRTAAALIALSAALPGWAADPSLPDSRPGHLMADFLKLCGTAKREDMMAWYQSVLDQEAMTRMSPADRANFVATDCEENGGFTVGEVTTDKPDRIEVVLQGKTSHDWFSSIVASDSAGKLDRGTNLTPSQPAESALPSDLSDEAVAKLLSDRVEQLGAAGKFSGIAVIARGSTLIAAASAGYADRAEKTMITPDTQFTLGSLGKMFTAAAVGQLIDRGRLSFDDKVGSIFPDYPNKTVRDKVTVGMLMSHTSGMGDFLAKRTPAMMKEGVRRAGEFMPLYDHDEPAFEPGTRWSYSNAGLALMGAIVEKRSGQSYADYIRRHIFKPAGMTQSDPNNIPRRSKSLVTPYTRNSLQGESLPDWQEAEHDIGSPAGGAISTARDLARFADALRNGTLFSRKTFDAMATNHNPLYPRTPGYGPYGYAMVLREIYGRPTVGHGGGFPGVNTELRFMPDAPYTVVVLANQDYPAADLTAALPIGLMVEKAKRGK